MDNKDLEELRRELDDRFAGLREQSNVLKSYLDFKKAEADEEIPVEEAEEETQDLDPAVEAARLQAEEQEEFLEQMYALQNGDPNALELGPSPAELRQREVLARAEQRRRDELAARDQANKASVAEFARDLLEDQLKRDSTGQVKRRLVEAAAHHEQLAKELGPTIEAGVQEHREAMAKLEEARIREERRRERTTYKF